MNIPKLKPALWIVLCLFATQVTWAQTSQMRVSPRMPDFVSAGTQIKEAVLILRRADIQLSINPKTAESHDKSEGAIIEQTPGPGVPLTPGMQITLVYAVRPQNGGEPPHSDTPTPVRVKVPLVTEMSLQEAQRRLEVSRLRADTANTPDARPDDWVVYQSPQADELVELGRSVFLRLQRRRPPPSPSPSPSASPSPLMVSVPDLANDSVDTARARLGSSLTLSIANPQQLNASSIVATQRPLANSNVPINSVVVVTVKDPPDALATVTQAPSIPPTPRQTIPEPPVIVPDVTKVPKDVAIQLLEAAQLKSGAIESIESSEAKADVVLRQAPAAGTSVPRNTLITLVVVKEKESDGTTLPWVLGIGLFAVASGWLWKRWHAPGKPATQITPSPLPPVALACQPQIDLGTARLRWRGTAPLRWALRLLPRYDSGSQQIRTTTSLVRTVRKEPL